MNFERKKMKLKGLIYGLLIFLLSGCGGNYTNSLLPLNMSPNIVKTPVFYKSSIERAFYTPTSNNKVEILINKDQIFPEMKRMIAGAKISIKMDIFLFSGKIGKEIADTLLQKYKNNVKIQVLLDPNLGVAGKLKKEEKELVKFLINNGIDVKTFNLDLLPDNSGILTNYAQIDHNKLLLVDNESFLIGGMNWSDVAASNRDIMLKITGSAAKQLADIMDEDWGVGNNLKIKAKGDNALIPAPFGTSQVRITQTGIYEKTIKKMILENIKNAKTSVYVGMYEFSDVDVVEALIAAHKKGLDVKVLLSRNEKYKKYIPFFGGLIHGTPNLATAQRLLEVKVPVRFFNPGTDDEEHHAKYSVVDHTIAMVGSVNYTYNAFNIFRETCAEVIDPQVAAKIENDMFMSDWTKKASPVKELTWTERRIADFVDYMERSHHAWW